MQAMAAKKKVALKGSLKADMVKELSRALKSKKKAAPAKSAPKTAKKAVAKKTPQKATAKKATKAAPRSAVKKASAPKKAAGKKKAPVAAAKSPDLGAMTMAELKVLAAKNKVTLKGRLKADIVKELGKALASQKPVEKKKAAPQKAVSKKATGEKALPVVGTAPPRPPARAGAQKKSNNKPAPKAALAPMAPAAANSGAWASAIAVEPGRIFVSWDIVESPLRKNERLVLRVVDMSAMEVHGMDAEGAYIQVPLKKTNGGMFLRVMAGRRFEAVVGKMTMDGSFIAFVSAQTVGTPPGRAPQGDSLLEDEHFAFTPSGKEPLSSF